LASKKSFVIAYTFSAICFTASGSYTNGIISTIEKQYKLSSAKIGVIYAFEDVMSGIVAIIIPYYTSKGHYPRWISFGLFLLGVSLVLQSAPYAVYGPGSDALSLTEEFGTEADLNMTLDAVNQKNRINLCAANS
jgi:solute carrier organic anion transporter family, member 5A